MLAKFKNRAELKKNTISLDECLNSNPDQEPGYIVDWDAIDNAIDSLDSDKSIFTEIRRTPIKTLKDAAGIVNKTQNLKHTSLAKSTDLQKCSHALCSQVSKHGKYNRLELKHKMNDREITAGAALSSVRAFPVSECEQELNIQKLRRDSH